MSLAENFRAQNAHMDMGVDENLIGRNSPLKKKLFKFLYHPTTEVVVMILVVFSIFLLVMEVAAPGAGGMMGSIVHKDSMEIQTAKGFMYWSELVVTLMFAIEYALKFWVAPLKLRFIKATWLDLMAIMPLMRVFRLGRALRMLRLFRLVRAIRMGSFVERALQPKEEVAEKTDTSVIALYLIFAVVFGTLGIMIFEKAPINDGFQTIWDGLWWCVVTLTTVGYGDISPQTYGGKIVAGIIMFIGLSFYALLTGTISTMLIERAHSKKEDKLRIDNLLDHTIVCGWNAQGKQLLENLLEDSSSSILVVTDQEIPKYKNHRLHYLKADPSTDAGLIQAHVERAKVAVILSNKTEEFDGQAIDAKTILIALSVEHRNPDIHTIVELNNPENIRHAKYAGVDEVIIAGAYTGAMLAQTAVSPGLTSVFTQLFGDQSVWLTTLELPEKWVGKTFAEVMVETTIGKKGTLVGLITDGVSRLDPEPSDILTPGDSLVLIRRDRST